MRRLVDVDAATLERAGRPQPARRRSGGLGRTTRRHAIAAERPIDEQLSVDVTARAAIRDPADRARATVVPTPSGDQTVGPHPLRPITERLGHHRGRLSCSAGQARRPGRPLHRPATSSGCVAAPRRRWPRPHAPRRFSQPQQGAPVGSARSELDQRPTSVRARARPRRRPATRRTSGDVATAWADRRRSPAAAALPCRATRPRRDRQARLRRRSRRARSTRRSAADAVDHVESPHSHRLIRRAVSQREGRALRRPAIRLERARRSEVADRGTCARPQLAQVDGGRIADAARARDRPASPGLACHHARAIARIGAAAPPTCGGRRTAVREAMLSSSRPGIRRHISSVADNPVVRRPGCPRRPQPEPPPSGGTPHAATAGSAAGRATPSRPPTSSTAGSPRPRPTLGDRLLILGHHYQRDEVIRWADARGDSFKLARSRRGQRPRPTVHRLLRRALHGRVGRRPHRRPPAGDPPRPQRRLLDGRHGRHRPGRGGLGGARPRSPTSSGSCPITYMNSSAALKAFVGEHGGAVCTSSNARAVLDWALGARATRCSSSPTSTSAATPASTWATATTDMRVWNPRFELGGLEERDVKDATLPALEGPLLGAPALPPRARRRVPGRAPRRRSSSCTPSARTTSCELADQVGSTELHPRVRSTTRRPGSVHRRRHRDPPGAAPGRRAPRQDRRVARPADLPVLDDVPHRRRPPRAGCSRTSSRARSSTRSPSTPTPPSGPRSRSSACSTSPRPPPRTDPELRRGHRVRPRASQSAARRFAPRGGDGEAEPLDEGGATGEAPAPGVTTSGPRSASCPATSELAGPRRRGRPAALVIGPRLRQRDELPAACAQATAQIEILAVEEVASSNPPTSSNARPAAPAPRSRPATRPTVGLRRHPVHVVAQPPTRASHRPAAGAPSSRRAPTARPHRCRTELVAHAALGLAGRPVADTPCTAPPTGWPGGRTRPAGDTRGVEHASGFTTSTASEPRGRRTPRF